VDLTRSVDFLLHLSFLQDKMGKGEEEGEKGKPTIPYQTSPKEKRDKKGGEGRKKTKNEQLFLLVLLYNPM